MADLKNLPKVQLAWMPKNKELRDRGARPLEHKHRDGTMEVVLPEERGGYIVYEVTDIYARQLLSECSKHFKLLEPRKMLIGFNTSVGGREFREVLSILTRKGFGDAENPEIVGTKQPPIAKEFGFGATEEIGPQTAAQGADAHVDAPVDAPTLPTAPVLPPADAPVLPPPGGQPVGENKASAPKPPKGKASGAAPVLPPPAVDE